MILWLHKHTFLQSRVISLSTKQFLRENAISYICLPASIILTVVRAPKSLILAGGQTWHLNPRILPPLLKQVRRLLRRLTLLLNNDRLVSIRLQSCFGRVRLTLQSVLQIVLFVVGEFVELVLGFVFTFTEILVDLVLVEFDFYFDGGLFVDFF